MFVDLFKSVAEVSTKNFVLQKSIATAIDSISTTTPEPKGSINVLRKNFEQNEGQSVETVPTVNEFTNVLMKSMEMKKINSNEGAMAISRVSCNGRVQEADMRLFKSCQQLNEE